MPGYKIKYQLRRNYCKKIRVCRQTIYREIKRGICKRNTDYTESTVYDPYVAEEHYQKLKERDDDLKIGSDLKLLHYIEKDSR